MMIGASFGFGAVFLSRRRWKQDPTDFSNGETRQLSVSSAQVSTNANAFRVSKSYHRGTDLRHSQKRHVSPRVWSLKDKRCASAVRQGPGSCRCLGTTLIDLGVLLENVSSSCFWIAVAVVRAGLISLVQKSWQGDFWKF